MRVGSGDTNRPMVAEYSAAMHSCCRSWIGCRTENRFRHVFRSVVAALITTALLLQINIGRWRSSLDSPGSARTHLGKSDPNPRESQFHRLKEGSNGAISYILLWNPYRVIKHHSQQGRVDKPLLQCIVDRMIEIGASDLEEPSPSVEASPQAFDTAAAGPA